MIAESGVHNALVIDLVGEDPQLNAFVLYMFEPREWEPSPERFEQLRAKVNSYLFHVTDGQLARQYPESLGKPLRFELRCLHTPDEQTLAYIAALQERLRGHGIKLVVTVSNLLSPGH
jgi:hypothetical protein